MKKVHKNWLEWTVFGVSAVLIGTVISFLVYESATIGGALPDIQLHTGTPEARSGYFAVPLEITNKGDQTAEGVHIEVVLRSGGQEERAATWKRTPLACAFTVKATSAPSRAPKLLRIFYRRLKSGARSPN